MSSHIQVSQWSNPDYKVSHDEIQAYLDDYKKALTTTLAELMIWYLQDEEQIKNSSKKYTDCIRKILVDSGISLPCSLNSICASGGQERDNDQFALSSEAPKSPKFDASALIHKPYLETWKDDFDDFIEERCRIAPRAAVELEFEALSAVCDFGINKRWAGYGFPNAMEGALYPTIERFNECHEMGI